MDIQELSRTLPSNDGSQVSSLAILCCCRLSAPAPLLANISFIVAMLLCQTIALAAIADVGQGNDMHIPYRDVFKKLDSKYGLIYGSPDSSFFLHYCLPGFVPIGEGDCKLGKAPGEDLQVVQVQYDYALNDSSKRGLLEGGGAFLFPFPVNVDLKGKLLTCSSMERRLREQRS